MVVDSASCLFGENQLVQVYLTERVSFHERNVHIGHPHRRDLEKH